MHCNEPEIKSSRLACQAGKGGLYASSLMNWMMTQGEDGISWDRDSRVKEMFQRVFF